MVEPKPEQEDSFVDAKAEEMSTVEEKLESPVFDSFEDSEVKLAPSSRMGEVM